MKKSLLNYMLVSLVIFSGMIQAASAQVLYEENFDYGAGTSLESVGFSVSSSTEPILVQTPGLEYTDFAASAVGNASYLPAADQDAYINFVPSSISSGTFYMAAMVQITGASTSGDYFFSLGTSDSNIKRGRVFAKDDGSGNIHLGVSKGSTSTVTYTTATYAINTTYLIVVKYTFNASANDDGVDLFIFDSSSDAFPTVEPGAATISATDASTSDAANLKKVHLRQDSDVQSVIDGIRITNSWEDAVSQGDDASLSDLEVDGTTITGFDAATLTYDVELAPGTVVVPPVTASTTDITASTVITDAADVNGQAIVVVTSEDGLVTATYTINFSVASLSAEKEILSFDIPLQISSSTDAGAFTISILMPIGTDVTALVPAITISDLAGISPLTDVAQDFTSAVTYTVTAEDASTQDWIVDVEVFTEMTPVYDGFDYPVGELLSAQSAGGWSALNTAGVSEIEIAAGNLSYNMLEPPLGNMVTFDGTGTDISKEFESQSTPGTTVYFSFLFQVTDMSAITSTVGTHIAGFVVPTSTYGAGVYVMWDQVVDSDKFFIGTAARSTTSSRDNGLIDWSATSYDINTPILIVGGYEIVDGSMNDLSYLWVNPESASFGADNAPTAMLSSTTTGGTSSDLSSVSRFYFRQDGSTSTPFLELDELRIGVNWADVTPEAGQITFYPANNDVDVSETVNPVVYYLNPVRQVGGVAIEDTDLSSLVTLKVDDASGADVAFTASISDDKKIVTVVPDADLTLETMYYLAVGQVEDENSATIDGEGIVFTTRLPTTNTGLTALNYNNIAVPDFDEGTFSYDIVLDYGTTDIPVLTWTLSDENASAAVTDLTSFPGTSIVTVTAEDGSTTETYSINFSVSDVQSDDATLSEIRINGELLPGFDPAVYEYQYALPFGTTTGAVISAVTNSAVATIVYAQPASTTSIGGVTVTAQDGTEAQYVIFFSVNPYIYSIGWIENKMPLDGWETDNIYISTNFGDEPVSSHDEFEGVFAFRFICPKSSSGSESGSLSTAMYPKSGTLRFWLYVQLPDGNEAMTISKHVKGAADTVVIATLTAADMASTDWKEFIFEINESDSTRIIFNSDITLDADTRIWIDDLSLRGMTNTGIFNDRYNNTKVQVYPNPASEILTIHPEKAKFDYIEIYNVNGQKVYDNTIITEKIQVNLSSFKTGVYTIRLKGKDEIHSSRFIVL